MAGASALQRMKLERRLAYLGTLGNNAPFIGLLGTVIGIVGAFEELGKARGPAAGRRSRGGDGGVAARPQAVMSEHRRGARRDGRRPRSSPSRRSSRSTRSSAS